MADLATPQSIARTQALSQMLGNTALQGSVRSPLQGLAGVARALGSSVLARRADEQQAARNKAANEALLALANPMGTPITPGGPVPLPGAPVPLPSGPVTGGGTPNLQKLLETQQQFPELTSALQPLIANAMQPAGNRFAPISNVEALGLPPGTVAQRNLVTGEIDILSGPQKNLRPIEVFDADSPTGSRFVSPAEAVGMAAPKSSGETIETFTNPDGTQGFRIVRGGGGGSSDTAELTKATTTGLEKSIVEANERLTRIRDIRESFDPSFLELPTQLFTKGAAMAERLGVELPPETKQRLAEFTQAKTNTLRNLNRTLNELSGAAVSPAEAERLKGELPTESDSPTEFAAKVDNIERQLTAAIARSQQVLEGGVRDLKFDKDGEVLNAPSLEEFMLRQDRDRQASVPAGNVSRETTQAGMGAAPQGNISQMSAEDILSLDIQSLTPEQREQVGRRMDALGL